MKEGAIAGFPLSHVKVSVYDGKEHPVDSKPVAFEIAARECFKLAVKDATPEAVGADHESAYRRTRSEHGRYYG